MDDKFVPYLNKIQWRDRGKKRGLTEKTKKQIEKELEILQKLAKFFM